jgi:sugar phosphate isomerase/epimerase
MKRFAIQFLFMPVLSLSLLGSLTIAAERSGAPPLTHAFFAFDNGVGRDQKWPPAQQAATLKDLGYDGIGYTGIENFGERQKAFREKGLQIFSLYVPCYVDRPVPYDPKFKSALAPLKGTDVFLWLTVQGKATNDAMAVRVVREIADAAQASGLRVALYPHKGFHVGTAEEAMRVVCQVDRPNVGVTINLCHELAAGNADRMDAVVRACAGRLFLVSINGADRTGGWEALIRPLGEGSFDVPGFLKMLGQSGYRGPIGLQCYSIKGDPTDILKRSMAAWRQWAVGVR